MVTLQFRPWTATTRAPLALVAALALAAIPARARAESAPFAGSGVEVLAHAECTVAGRPMEVAVLEVTGSDEIFRNTDACLRMPGWPTACLGFVAESVSFANRLPRPTFMVACVPDARMAWALASVWNDHGLSLRAWRMNLTSLSLATLEGPEGGREVVVPDMPGIDAGDELSHVVPELRPGATCTDLRVSLVASESRLEVEARPEGTCEGWRVRFEAALGGAFASPLPHAASPSSPGQAVAPAEPDAGSEAVERRRAPVALMSFSRR